MTIKQHKIRSRIIIAAAIVVIFSALVFTLLRAAIPYLTNYGEDIERELSSLLNMPVEIGMVDADISWLVPRLKLLDVSVYDQKHERHLLHFREISISLNWTETIRNLSPELGDIFVFGMDLQVERDTQGKFLIQGMELAQTPSAEDSSEKIRTFFANTSLYLVNSTIRWLDHLNNSQKLDLTNVNFTMINSGSNHEVSIDVDLPASYGRHLQLMSEFEGEIDAPESWQGKLFVAADNLQLESWLNDYWEFIEFPGSGRLTMNAWLEFEGFSVQKLTTSLSCNDLVLYYLDKDVQGWELDYVSFKSQWYKKDNTDFFDVSDFYLRRNSTGWPQKARLSLKVSDQQEIDFKADYARLEDYIYIAQFLDAVSQKSSFEKLSLIDVNSLQADVYDVSLELDPANPEDIKLSGYLTGFGFESKSSIPSVRGLDAKLLYDVKGGQLNLDSNDVVLDFNDLFRNKLFVSYLSGQVNVTQKQEGWYIESNQLVAQTAHIGTESRLQIVIPDQGSVFMDIFSRLYDGDGSYTNLYLPARIMSKKTVNWLDHAFVRADIPRGGFVYYGEVQHFPFKKGEGVMEVLFDVEHAKLGYLPDWPAISSLKAGVRFYNSSLSIDHATGHVYGAELNNIKIAIDDFSEAHLSIDGKITSPLSDMLLFVRESPLKNMLGDFVAGLEGRGGAGLDLNLQIPLAMDEALKVNGELKFKNNEINFPSLGYLLKNVNGDLMFTESTTRAEQLLANMDGHAIGINIQTENPAQKSEINISVAGQLPVKSALSPVPVLKSYFDGVTDMKAEIKIPVSEQNKRQPKVSIDVISELVGVSSSLPEPFAKLADTRVPLDLKIRLNRDDALELSVLYDNSVKYRAKRMAQSWNMNLQSPSLSGAIKFSAESFFDKPVRLDIDYLNTAPYLARKESEMDFQISPVDLPPLKVIAKEIVWKDVSLKNINIKTRQSKSGMVFDRVEVDLPDLQVKGKGSWLKSWRYENRTTFDFTATTKNLGSFLHKLDISDGIKGTEGSASFKWSWNAEPYKFSWGLVEGTSSLKLEDGKLADLKPGAGRILGILNFETLLSMDFGDQASGGFAFDDMHGTFNFDRGNMYTQDFEIEGKVADIKMQGRVGLTAKDFDQTITVTPGVGSTLSVIGYLTSGATVGAAILFFQKILGLDKIAEYKYSVTGSWDEPKVTLLSAPEETRRTTTEKATDDDF